MSDSENQVAYAELFSEIFYEQFISAYYVNLLDFSYVVYYCKKGLEKKYGNGENAVSALQKFISEDVHPDDRDVLKDMLSVAYVRGRLKKESSFSFVVREIVTGKERYCKLQVTRGRDEDHMAICFLNVDDEIRKRMKVEEGYRVIQALAMEFNALYRIDLDSEKMHSYVKSQTARVFEKELRGEMLYSEALEKYAREIVSSEDAKRVLTLASIESIRERFSRQSHFEVDYKNRDGRYFQMKFVRVSDEKSPVVV